MKKGKINKQKRVLSVAVIPHSLDNVKVIRFSALYIKLAAAGLIILAMLVTACIFAYTTYSENHKLKNSNDSLIKLNLDQKNLLNENADTIDKLKDIENSYNEKIKEYDDKYNEMAQKYLSSRGEPVRSSRSGGTSATSFVNDAKALKDILSSLDQLDISRGISETDLGVTEKNLDEYLDSMPTAWPTSGKISSPFGGRRDPFNFKSKFHTGIDIAAPYGQNIRASGSGTVTTASRTSVYGNTVIINHGHGITTMYGHASKILVKKGQKVVKGTVIARVGSSGRSTGSHLHFEVRINGNSVNPLEFLDSK